MAFQVSPGVNVSEVDLTAVIPAVSTSVGGIAGIFKWGPAEERVLVDSEDALVERFGKPAAAFNQETFHVASSFLSYSNALFVVRALSASDFNAVSAGTASNANVQVKNTDDWELNRSSKVSDANTFFIAKWAGDLGNNLRVSVCDSSAAFESTPSGNITLLATGANSMTVDADNTTKISVGDIIEVGNTTTGKQELVVSAINTTVVSTKTNFTGTSNVVNIPFKRRWGFKNAVAVGAPGTSVYANNRGGSADELHIVVVDEDGGIAGSPNTVLEVFTNVSRASDAKNESGESIYYRDVIDNQSQYVWAGNGREGAAYVNTAANMAAISNTTPLYDSLSGGVDLHTESNATLGVIASGYDLFKDTSSVDVSLLMTGKSHSGSNDAGVANYLIDNIASVRKDCVVFASPGRADVVNNINGEMDDIISFRDSISSSSYAVIDSGYKYTYDKFNDAYIHVPLNGDIAGLCARTDQNRDPWFSPAGFARGNVKNVVKLSYNPEKAERDQLYQKDINPVVTFPGKGTVLFGDKTAQGTASAFDRINVRRLFIVLEKAIATASEFALFEFNDEFTRAQFKNLVEPFLREVQGRRGIFDFKVVCDETNNTGEVIDQNQFVGDIFIKPAKSINFIQLNFVAVRTGVEFSEIVGSV